MSIVNRFIFNVLQQDLDRPEINILLGARQVGKTTLLRALEARARQQGRTTCFFDLEQPSVLAEFNRPDPEIIERIRQAGDVVFIDEFQYLKDASRLFKAIYDAPPRVKLICSGSSSLEIHTHLRESLAGRRFLFRVYPLQYAELRAAEPSYALDRFLQYGGMPALTGEASDARRQQILSELLSAYLLKDVKALVKEENLRAFNHLLYLLAERQGSLVSVHSLAGEIGMSAKAVTRYLDILEGTYVNFRVSSYTTNLGNELKKSCKTYLYDVGIRNAIVKDFSPVADRPDAGLLLESAVFLELQSRLRPNMALKFWRTKEGDEVDFILVKDRRPVPIEVKRQVAPSEVPKGLRRFLLRYPATTTAYVVNERTTGTVRHGDCAIHYVPPTTLDQVTA